MDSFEVPKSTVQVSMLHKGPFNNYVVQQLSTQGGGGKNGKKDTT